MNQTQNDFKLFTRIQDSKHSLETLRLITKSVEARFGEAAQIKTEHKGNLVNVYIKLPQ